MKNVIPIFASVPEDRESLKDKTLAELWSDLERRRPDVARHVKALLVAAMTVTTSTWHPEQSGSQ